MTEHVRGVRVVAFAAALAAAAALLAHQAAVLTVGASGLERFAPALAGAGGANGGDVLTLENLVAAIICGGGAIASGYLACAVLAAWVEAVVTGTWRGRGLPRFARRLLVASVAASVALGSAGAAGAADAYPGWIAPSHSASDPSSDAAPAPPPAASAAPAPAASAVPAPAPMPTAAPTPAPMPTATPVEAPTADASASPAPAPAPAPTAAPHPTPAPAPHQGGSHGAAAPPADSVASPGWRVSGPLPSAAPARAVSPPAQREHGTAEREHAPAARERTPDANDSSPPRSHPASQESPAAGASDHVVQPGDSLWRIAATRLGPGATHASVAAAWPSIYEANREVIGDDPGLIRPGQRLRIPAEVAP